MEVLNPVEMDWLMLDDILGNVKDNVLINNFKKGKFLDVLLSASCEEMFGKYLEQRGTEPLDALLLKSVQDFIEKYCSSFVRLCDFFCVGVASLLAFVQSNWTGRPHVDVETDECLLSWLRDAYADPQDLREEVRAVLTLDGEYVVDAVHDPEFLLVARIILQYWVDAQLGTVSSKLWWFRCLFLHQQILEEFSGNIHSSLMDLLEDIAHTEKIQANISAKVQFHLEAAIVLLYYGQVHSSRELFDVAQEASGLKLELVGAMGRRTRFQERDIAQLTLSISKGSYEDDGAHLFTPPSEDIPQNLPLDSDVRLDKIKFEESSAGDFPSLSPLEQCIVLGKFLQVRKSQPFSELTEEELVPYLSCVLSEPQVWAIQRTTLLHRCNIEKNSSRTVERAMMQLQALVDSISSRSPSMCWRIRYLFASGMPPRWKVEKALADILRSLGAVNSALDIYKHLKQWEDVITCYNMLELRHKAAEIIQEQMQKQETVKLWCMLGDATDDPSCYEKAWILSKCKSGSTQRHWALYFYNRKQYAQSIPHFKESLAINSLQDQTWLRLGYAALVQEDWELSAAAYRRYCSLDPDNFEAWNNLAKSYVQTGQKRRAWLALKEALKRNYENWQVWDNLMLVSIDLRELEEVIICYHKLLDFKGRHLDTEVLGILVMAIINNVSENSAQVRRKAMGLFGRLTGMVTNNSILWQLYARLSATCEDQSAETQHKTAVYLQKAYRSATQQVNWVKESATCIGVINLCIELADAYLMCSCVCKDPRHAMEMLTSAKLALGGVVAKVKKQYTTVTPGEMPEQVTEPLKELQGKLSVVVEEMDAKSRGSSADDVPPLECARPPVG